MLSGGVGFVVLVFRISGKYVFVLFFVEFIWTYLGLIVVFVDLLVFVEVVK